MALYGFIPFEADRKVERLKSELESEKAGLSGTNHKPAGCVKYHLVNKHDDGKSQFSEGKRHYFHF